MHMDVNASPKTKYTIDTIMTSWLYETIIIIRNNKKYVRHYDKNT